MRVEGVMLVGVWKTTLIRKISHERAALGSAGRKTGALDVEQFSADRHFPGVVARVTDARKGGAMSVPKRISADPARPTGIMPWHADRDVLRRQPTTTFNHNSP